jgi:hypothetical protein
MLPPVDRRLPRSSMRARTTNERNERVTGTATDSPNFKHKISPINTPTPNSRPLHRSTLLRQEQFRMRKKKSNGWCNCRTFGSATASLAQVAHTHATLCVVRRSRCAVPRISRCDSCEARIGRDGRRGDAGVLPCWLHHNHAAMVCQVAPQLLPVCRANGMAALAGRKGASDLRHCIAPAHAKTCFAHPPASPVTY